MKNLCKEHSGCHILGIQEVVRFFHLCLFLKIVLLNNATAT